MATDVGAVYRSSLTVRNDADELADPDTISFTVTKPDFTTATVGNVRDSLGLYHADYTMAAEGLHKFVWTTTNPNVPKVDYENARAWRSVLGMGEMRNFLHLSDTTQDELLRDLMHFATYEAERIAGTCVPKVVTKQRIPGTQRNAIRVPSAPILEDTDITIESAWPGGPSWKNDDTTTDLMVSYETGVLEPLSMIGFWYGPWSATYTAGRLIMPPNVTLAVKLIVNDLWAFHRAAIDDPMMPDEGEQVALEARIPPGYEIPFQAKALLQRGGQPGFS